MAINPTIERNTFVVAGEMSAMDNEVIDIIKMSGPGKIRHVTFSTSAALGGGLSVDLVNAGINGTATTVVQKSSDNLAGEEEFAGVNSALQDGDVLRILCDDITAVDVSWAIEIDRYSG